MQSVLGETVVLHADPEPDDDGQPLFFLIFVKRWSGHSHLDDSGDMVIV